MKHYVTPQPSLSYPRHCQLVFKKAWQSARFVKFALEHLMKNQIKPSGGKKYGLKVPTEMEKHSCWRSTDELVQNPNIGPHGMHLNHLLYVLEDQKSNYYTIADMHGLVLSLSNLQVDADLSKNKRVHTYYSMCPRLDLEYPCDWRVKSLVFSLESSISLLILISLGRERAVKLPAT